MKKKKAKEVIALQKFKADKTKEKHEQTEKRRLVFEKEYEDKMDKLD